MGSSLGGSARAVGENARATSAGALGSSAAPLRGLGKTLGLSCAGQCQVMQDVATGWSDTCIGLQTYDSNSTAAECGMACCDDPKCEVWQWGNERSIASRTSLGVCKTGRGLECSSDRLDNFLVLSGQRISHGRPSATRKLDTGLWCTGAGMRQGTVGIQGAPPDQSLKSCAEACYTDSRCSLWQYSATEGCWYGYADVCSERAPVASTMIAGEQVTRACVSGSRAEGQPDFLQVFGCIGAVASLFTIVALMLFMCGPLLFNLLGQDICQIAGRRKTKERYFPGLRLTGDPATPDNMDGPMCCAGAGVE